MHVDVDGEGCSGASTPPEDVSAGAFDLGFSRDGRSDPSKDVVLRIEAETELETKVRRALNVCRSFAQMCCLPKYGQSSVLEPLHSLSGVAGLNIKPTPAWSLILCVLLVQRVMRLLHTALFLGFGAIVTELTLKLAKVGADSPAEQDV